MRVVQWTTGNVGRRSVIAITANPGLELVGCFAWGADKVGRDVGELCGIDPLGVTATDDVDALFALRPDCIVYNPKWPDVDEMVRILEAGINVVSTAAFITGHSLGEGRDRLIAACERGGVSIFGSGINPGFANMLAILAGGICDRVDSVTMLESADSTGYDSPETEIKVGFGRPIDDPALPEMVQDGPRCSRTRCGWWPAGSASSSTDVRCVAEFAAAPADVVMKSWTIEQGCVAGVSASWQGWVGDRKVVDMRVRWRKGPSLEPNWEVGEGYLVEIQGQPAVRLKMEIFPPPDFVAKTFDDFMVLGMIMTAMPAIDAIPAVCAAAPGIVTYLDLPLITPRGFVPAS